MDPHTHDHKQLIMNTSWGEGSSILVENMASMDNHQHSHVFFHDQQHHHDPLLTSLDHHSPVWRSCSTDDTSYIVPLYHSNHIISSARPSSSAASLRFVGSSHAAHHHVGLPTDHHHQVTLDHRYLFSQVLCEEDEQGDKDKPGNNKDLCVDVNEGDEGIDHEEDEELSAMKEMMYKIAAMQPVDIDPSTICKPNRRNVRISDDPQSVAARHRRERISEKMRILQRLVPGGTKMDTASMLDEAIRYVKFLKRQIKHLQQDQNHPVDQMLPASSASLKSSSLLDSTSTPFNHQYRTAMANKQHQQQPVRFTAAASPSTATDDRNYGTINSALLHHRDHLETENPLEIMNMCTSSNNKVHHCMDNSSVVVIQNHLQIDILNQQQGSDRKLNTCYGCLSIYYVGDAQ